MELVFSLPTRVRFGAGATASVARELKALGCSHPLLVTDPGIVRGGLLAGVEESLRKGGLSWAVFSDVEANPTDLTVGKCLAAWREHRCDAFLAVGGGSSMDTAKGAAILATNGGHIWDYDGFDRFDQEPAPVLAIPTTAGTGSEVSWVASIVDSRRHTKLSVRHSLWGRARVAILDPTMLASVPVRVAVATGLDALTHNIEAYTSLQASPFSDACARQGIELIGAHIRRFVADRSDPEAAAAMLAGSSLGAMAFSAAGTGNAHCLARFLVPQLDMEHGMACAVALPYVMDYNCSARPERFSQIAAALGEPVHDLPVNEAAPRAAQAVRRLLRDVGGPLGLSQARLTAADREEMAQLAANSGYERWNPRPTGIEGFREILERMSAD